MCWICASFAAHWFIEKENTHIARLRRNTRLVSIEKEKAKAKAHLFYNLYIWLLKTQQTQKWENQISLFDGFGLRATYEGNNSNCFWTSSELITEKYFCFCFNLFKAAISIPKVNSTGRFCHAQCCKRGILSPIFVTNKACIKGTLHFPSFVKNWFVSHFLCINFDLRNHLNTNLEYSLCQKKARADQSRSLLLCTYSIKWYSFGVVSSANAEFRTLAIHWNTVQFSMHIA